MAHHRGLTGHRRKFTETHEISGNMGTKSWNMDENSRKYSDSAGSSWNIGGNSRLETREISTGTQGNYKTSTETVRLTEHGRALTTHRRELMEHRQRSFKFSSKFTDLSCKPCG